MRSGSDDPATALSTRVSSGEEADRAGLRSPVVCRSTHGSGGFGREVDMPSVKELTTSVLHSNRMEGDFEPISGLSYVTHCDLLQQGPRNKNRAHLRIGYTYAACGRIQCYALEGPNASERVMSVSERGNGPTKRS